MKQFHMAKGILFGLGIIILSISATVFFITLLAMVMLFVIELDLGWLNPVVIFGSAIFICYALIKIKLYLYRKL